MTIDQRQEMAVRRRAMAADRRQMIVDLRAMMGIVPKAARLKTTAHRVTMVGRRVNAA
jgi:hypothetical protein